MKAVIFVGGVEAMRVEDTTGKSFGDVLPAEVKALMPKSLVLTNGKGPYQIDEASDQVHWHSDVKLYKLDTPLPEAPEIHLGTVIPRWYRPPALVSQEKYKGLSGHILLLLTPSTPAAATAARTLDLLLLEAGWHVIFLPRPVQPRQLRDAFIALQQQTHPVRKFEVLYSLSRKKEVLKIREVASKIGTELVLTEVTDEALGIFTDWKDTAAGRFGQDVCNLLGAIDCARFLDWLVEKRVVAGRADQTARYN